MCEVEKLKEIEFLINSTQIILIISMNFAILDREVLKAR